jgi:hypothetical protein
MNPEAIEVAVSRTVLVSGPVAAFILLQQTIVGQLIENPSAKTAVQINRYSLRRPDPKRCAVGAKRRAAWRLRRNMLLGKHRVLPLHSYRRRLPHCVGVASDVFSIAQLGAAGQRDGVLR